MRAQSAFGEELKEVQQVNAIDTSASLGTVDAHLDMLRPAISNYGGSVQVPPPPLYPPGGSLTGKPSHLSSTLYFVLVLHFL